jgi:hypothetical protein
MIFTILTEFQIREIQDKFRWTHHGRHRESYGFKVSNTLGRRTKVDGSSFGENEDAVELVKGACGRLVERSDYDHLISMANQSFFTPCSWAVLRRQAINSLALAWSTPDVGSS